MDILDWKIEARFFIKLSVNIFEGLEFPCIERKATGEKIPIFGERLPSNMDGECLPSN